MNYLAAQQGLAATVKQISKNNSSYFWRLSGGHANSLCKLLCIEEEEMKCLLRLCQVYKGPKDHLNRNNLELFLAHCSVTDFNPFKPKTDKKADYFIRLVGSGGEATLPAEQCDQDGELSVCPAQDKHFRQLRSRSQKGNIPDLLSVAKAKEDAPPTPRSPKDKTRDSSSAREFFMSHVSKIVADAARNGNGNVIDFVKRCRLDANKPLKQADKERHFAKCGDEE